MEYDLNIRLSILVGQVWAESKGRKSVSRCPSRTGGLSSLDPRRASRRLSLFSTLSVGDRAGRSGSSSNQRKLASVDWKSRSVADIIVALWENGAVVTKAAQQLYLHRNSLQYKIDKWEELTGLQLKKSDWSGSLLPFSLARCHLNWNQSRVLCNLHKTLFFFLWDLPWICKTFSFTIEL